MAYRIEATSLSRQRTLVVRGPVAPIELGGFLGYAFERVEKLIREYGFCAIGAPFARFGSSDDDRWEVEAGYPLRGDFTGRADVEASVLPGGPAVRTVHIGAYTDTEHARRALLEWAEEHSFEPAGDEWEVYLDGPERADPRTEVVLPVRPQREGRTDSHTFAPLVLKAPPRSCRLPAGS
jgi:effector-binding domain-containing protein